MRSLTFYEATQRSPVLRVVQFVEALDDLQDALRRELSDALVVMRKEEMSSSTFERQRRWPVATKVVPKLPIVSVASVEMAELTSKSLSSC